MILMQNAAAFLKPIAHRGLHDGAQGRLENTAAAFEAAIAKGYGIECDVRPAACGTPMVFHDAALERLIDSRDAVRAHDATALKRFQFRDGCSHMLELSELLELVGGREPVLAEIKSEWEAPDPKFLMAIATAAAAYRGPVALMSFDPAVMAALKELAPEVPRGMVSGLYEGEGWWRDKLGAERAYRLSHFLESRAAAPDFYAYDVKALPTPVTRFVREVLGAPFFTWTVRSEEDRKVAARWADAAIFEGYEP
jgi:glycerophosphoryl diester phosphodiesterase